MYEHGGIAIWQKGVNAGVGNCRQDETQLYDYLEGMMNTISQNFVALVGKLVHAWLSHMEATCSQNSLEAWCSFLV